MTTQKLTHIKITAMLMAFVLVFCFFSVPKSFASAAGPTFITIKFAAQGGSSVEDIRLPVGDSIDTAPVTTRSGYVFAGWSYSVGGSAIVFPYYPGASGILYALWVAAGTKFTVSFSTAGGSSVPSQQVTVGNSPTVPTNPTRTGYTFAGWTPSLSTKIYANTTFTAQWAAIQYTVTFQWFVSFNPLEPPPIPIITTHTYNQGAQIIAPTNWQSYIPNTWYIFLGWSTTAPAGLIHAGPVNITTFPTATQDITYYAVWGTATYTIIWDAKGGSFSN